MWFEIQVKRVWGHDGQGGLWKVARHDLAELIWRARHDEDQFVRHPATCTQGRSYSPAHKARDEREVRYREQLKAERQAAAQAAMNALIAKYCPAPPTTDPGAWEDIPF